MPLDRTHLEVELEGVPEAVEAAVMAVVAGEDLAPAVAVERVEAAVLELHWGEREARMVVRGSSTTMRHVHRR